MGLDLGYSEGQTPIDENEKEGLKIKSITTQKELDEFEQLNIERAVEWSIRTRLKVDKILTEKFIKDLHYKMFSDVWKWAGQFRRSEKNIGVTWPLINVELKTLLDDAKYWIKNETFTPDEIAIRFKHRMVSIHCFPNGNGRHSRLMADIVIEKIFKKEVFSWHQSDLSQPNEIRKKYISASEKQIKVTLIRSLTSLETKPNQTLEL